MIVVKDLFEAWVKVKEMFPGMSLFLDTKASEKAGYKIFRDENEYYNYVCYLGDRLEVNLKEETVVNIFIEPNYKSTNESKESYNSKLIVSKYYEILNKLERRIELEENKYPLTERERIFAEAIVEMLKALGQDIQ